MFNSMVGNKFGMTLHSGERPFHLESVSADAVPLGWFTKLVWRFVRVGVELTWAEGKCNG